MLNCKLNSNLLKFLIDFDFLILDKQSHNGQKFNSRYSKLELNFYKKTNTLYLDPIELIKTLKQTIRILQYLKKQKNPVLHLCSENTYILESFQLLLSKKNKTLENFIFNKSIFLKNSKKFANCKFLIGDVVYKKGIYEKIFKDKNFLINSINANNIFNDYGTYRLYNNISSWKKIVFIALLIKNFYKN
jgi:hypothetical protein